MKTTNPYSFILFKNNANPLSVYNRINIRNIGYMVLLGEPLVGLEFADN